MPKYDPDDPTFFSDPFQPKEHLSSAKKPSLQQRERPTSAGKLTGPPSYLSLVAEAPCAKQVDIDRLVNVSELEFSLDPEATHLSNCRHCRHRYWKKKNNSQEKNGNDW